MMRMVRSIALVGVLTVLTAAVLGQSLALEPTRVAVIRASQASLLNERVRVDGFVTQFVDTGSRSTSFYYLKDDWGGIIKVRTSKNPPSVNTRYSIEGPVGLDPVARDIYISEEVRLESVPPPPDSPEIVIASPLPGAQTESETVEVTGTWRNIDPGTIAITGGAERSEVKTRPTSETSGTFLSTVKLNPATSNTITVNGSNRAGLVTATTADVTHLANRTWLYAVIAGAVVLILAISAILMIRTRKPDTIAQDYSVTSPAIFDAPPPPEQVIEGRTIKLHAPPPNTVKLLPGWFEVLAGDDLVKQIRFYRLGGERGAETTFGRASGRPYAHIQIKAPTVSSRQAKLAFDNGAAHLTNFAAPDSNPTKVNGRELGVDESILLSESDRVEMGEVSMLFHTAPVSSKIANA